MAYWFLCNKFKPAFAPYYAYLHVFLFMLSVTLGYWGLLPASIKKVHPDFEDDTIYFVIVFFTLTNYTSFAQTVLIAPILFTLSLYFQVVKSAEMIQFDPYTGEHLASEEVVASWLFTMWSLLGCSIVHHYLVQKDLAISVIQQKLVSRQQSQLTAHLHAQDDIIFVVSNENEEPEVVLQNQAANHAFAELPDVRQSTVVLVDSFESEKTAHKE
jgi:hypothetical protein